MKKYLLDTNICIHYLKGQFNLAQKIKDIGVEKCYVSIMTIAELKYGIEKSARKEQNKDQAKIFTESQRIIPLQDCLDLYAIEKVRLQCEGRSIADFDLLIGVTAVAHNMILVTRNVKHFQNIQNIVIENWID